MFTHQFNQDLDFLLSKIIKKEPFAFARYADGELAVMRNHHITGCDGWSVTEQDKPFAEELKTSLSHKEDNYFYGISCPCCDSPAHIHFKNLLYPRWNKTTFSNLFVNSNWKKSYNFFMGYENKIFICNENAKLNVPFVKVPADVLNSFRTNKEVLKKYYSEIARNHSNVLFCISAGPLAELIIHWMYTENPENQYVDIGSCLDVHIHGKATRSYHTQNGGYSDKVCNF